MINSIYSIPSNFIGSLEHLQNWRAWVDHIAGMGFDAVHLTPFCQRGEQLAPSGKYGCYYSIKDHRAFDPSIAGGLSETEATQAMQQVTGYAEALGVAAVFDLVLNHTAPDHRWASEQPELYDTESLTVNGDPWDDVRPLKWSNQNIQPLVEDAIATIEWAQSLGFTAIRADFPHNIPHHAWEQIINPFPELFFVAETVGCGHRERTAISKNFHAQYSSHFWSEGRDAWLIEERNLLVPNGIVATLGSHDEPPLTKKLLNNSPLLSTDAIAESHRQRYFAASTFGNITLMPAGYEFCSYERMHVLNYPAEERFISLARTPDQMLPNSTECDLRSQIAAMNEYKGTHPILSAPLPIDSKPLDSSGLFIQWRWTDDETLVSVHNVNGSQLPRDVIRIAYQASGSPENFVPIAENNDNIPSHAIFYRGKRPDWLDSLVTLSR